jgi:hypothetical protein
MVSKKQIIILAITGLLFSCQKENIYPNNLRSQTFCCDDEPSASKKANITNGQPLAIPVPINPILIDASLPEVAPNNNSEITDPNNDDDRNKKKKN